MDGLTMNVSDTAKKKVNEAENRAKDWMKKVTQRQKILRLKVKKHEIQTEKMNCRSIQIPRKKRFTEEWTGNTDRRNGRGSDDHCPSSDLGVPRSLCPGGQGRNP